MTRTFDQAIRDAQTILEAKWPEDVPPLTQDEKRIVAVIMHDYAVQCQLAFAHEMTEMELEFAQEMGRQNE